MDLLAFVCICEKNGVDFRSARLAGSKHALQAATLSMPAKLRPLTHCGQSAEDISNSIWLNHGIQTPCDHVFISLREVISPGLHIGKSPVAGAVQSTWLNGGWPRNKERAENMAVKRLEEAAWKHR